MAVRKLGSATGNRFQPARQCVADLRAGGRYPDDLDVGQLADELSAGSPQFAELWAALKIEVQRTITKRTVHPTVGELELDCKILTVRTRSTPAPLHRRTRDVVPPRPSPPACVAVSEVAYQV
jgi:hypothetical protein